MQLIRIYISFMFDWAKDYVGKLELEIGQNIWMKIENKLFDF